MKGERPVIDLQLDRAHSARMYDYCLGGRTNFLIDREAIAKIIALYPSVLVAARANREFMHRTTRYLTRLGIRQFLDIGTGIPTQPNLHEVAQSIAPEARIVYVDNDPIVLAHAQALLQSNDAGVTAYVQADITDPESVLNDPAVRSTFDLTRPVALSLNMVLPMVPDDAQATAAMATLKDALAPGSALVISHATSDFTGTLERLGKVFQEAGGAHSRRRSKDEVAAFFDGWDLVEPGVCTTLRWRPEDPTALGDISDAEISAWAGVAIKPAP